MKFINKIKYVSFMALIIIFSACEDGFDELNKDPNSATTVSAGSLFANALFNLSYTYWDRDLNFEFGALMTQQMAQNEYTDEQNYNFGQADFNFRWGNLYAGQNVDAPRGGIMDIIEAKKLVEASSIIESQKNNQLAALDIFKAFSFQIITDMWGDVPYSQAFQAQTYPFPAYDSQEDIYKGMISNVKAAIASIDTSVKGFESGDVLFSGNMAKWKAFGNAMLIRLGMRLTEVDETLAKDAVSAGFGGDLPTDNVALAFEKSQAISNPFYQDLVVSSRDDFRISKLMVDKLQDQNDPRLAKYADTTANGTYVGMPYGLNDAGATTLKTTTSDIGKAIEDDPEAPAYLMTLSEIEFFRAEAIARGYITGDDAAAFAAAIDASLTQWDVATDGFAAGIPYDATDLDSKLKSIAEQKWIALYSNGTEAFAEWRRLGLPQLPVSPNAVDGVTSIPVRMLYPITESGSNGAELDKVGEITLATPVWWDK